MSDPSSDRLRPGQRHDPWVVGLLLVATALGYLGSMAAPLIFDDIPTILRNPSIRELWPLTTVLHPPAAMFTAGRPLANLTFALNFALGGTGVIGLHATNLAFHFLATLTLYGVLRRTAQSAMRDAPAVRPDDARLFVITVTAAWALHPVLTSSVTYISQRTELLMGFCYLLTLYAFIRSNDARRPWTWRAASVGACFCGVCAKEPMVTAPVLVLAYDYVFVARSLREIWQRRRWYYAGLACTWGVLAMLLATGLSNRDVGFDVGVTWWRYALTEAGALMTYWRTAVWPHPLVFDYGVEYATLGWRSVAALGCVAALLAVTVRVATRWKRAGFVAAAFFLILAPTSSVVPVASQPIAENRLYLPLAALVTLAAIIGYALAGRTALRALLVGAAALLMLTASRNRVYADPLLIWRQTIAARPENPRAYDNYGAELTSRGRYAEAERSYTTALQLNPRSAATHGMLADALLASGRVDQAIAQYNDALALKPTSWTARFGLAHALQASGRYPEACAQYREVVNENPDNVEAQVMLAALLPHSTDEWHRHYLRAVELMPRRAAFAYANVLVGLGRTADAIPFYEAAIQADAGFAAAHVGLASALISTGRPADAVAACRRAVALEPTLASAHLDLGVALFQLGQREQAIDELKRATELDPASTAARQTLLQAQAQR